MKFFFALMFLTLFSIQRVDAVEPVGKRGIVTGCGITSYTLIGNFSQAKSLSDACVKAGSSHADAKRGAKALDLYSTKGELKNGGRCYFAPNEGLCGVLGGVSTVCPMNSTPLDESSICVCNSGFHEDAGVCTPGKSNCDEVTRNLKALGIPATDPRYGFYRKQKCIGANSAGEKKIVSNPVLRALVPGQVQWDDARTDFFNGRYGGAALHTGLMLGEQVMTALTFGEYQGARAATQASAVAAENSLAKGVRELPALRQQYVDAVSGLAQKGSSMRASGSSAEEIARTLHAERRALGEQFKSLTPPEKLAEIYERNIQKYGDKLGPSIDWLRNENKSWDQIINSASRAGGKDLGF
jgi:hypothetical protein